MFTIITYNKIKGSKMYNMKKLEKALDSLEMKANYVNSEYYYPRYQKLLKLIGELK